MIGRTAEKARLAKYAESEESEFVAVYGRRRVGKTYLIRQTFQGRFSFQHTGVARGSTKELFRETTGTKKAVHLTYVTTYGLKRNKHSGIVQSEVRLDDLFRSL